MKISSRKHYRRGFALIVTLSLMILLTVIAVGLLSLSSISLRASGQGNSMAVARANARLALQLAIGELQKKAGPDQRITAPANLVNNTASAGVTGVWKSWRPPLGNADYTSPKTGTNFLGYLMSNPNPATLPDPKVVTSGTSKIQQLVGPKSVGSGNASREIGAPLVSLSSGKPNIAAGAISWVTLDEGVKGRIDLLPARETTGLGDSVTLVGAPARNGFETVEKMDFLKAKNDQLRLSLPKLISLNEANLQANTADATKQYFHDFTVSSSSLQVDVANGGLKTDLSVLFDGNYGAALPASHATRFVYSDTTTPYQGNATNSDVQWSLYANYSRLYRRTNNNDNPQAGLKATAAYQLKAISDTTLKSSRFEPNMSTVKQPILMPTVVRVDTVFSLVTRTAHQGRGSAAYPDQLHLMYLPVITLHNPYNVPLRVSGMEVEFADIPIGFEFLVNGLPTTTLGLMPLNALYSTTAGRVKTFNIQLSNSLGAANEVVMGAGATRIFGTPFEPNTTWAAELQKNGKGQGLLFDWQSNQSSSAFSKQGMITGVNDSVGFDIDYLAPSSPSAWLTARKSQGVVLLKKDDKIQVRYGPVIPTTASASNSFSIKVRMGAGNQVGQTQIFYANAARLKQIMEEGTSERFSEKRAFPEIWPRGGESPKLAADIFEADTTPVNAYQRARPFAIFSVSAKTTRESFVKSRPVADTGVAFQMATCDFTTTASQGASPLEFALVPVKSGGLVIESGGETEGAGSKKTSIQGFFFGGHGSINGTTNATFYEIPMAPLQSIAQLRHANAGSIGSAPYVAYTVGESRAHPAIPPADTFFQADTSRNVLDHSWLANDQLWDRHWFSTLATLQGMAYSGSSAYTSERLAQEFFDGTTRLPNPRNSPYIPSGKTKVQAVTAARIPAGTQSAAHIMTDGGFNVNSTSIPAWISVLSSLSTADVPLAAGAATEKDPAGTPFLRVRQPAKGLGAAAGKDKLWNSYRTLDATEIASLAKEIVAEIKTRGPFLSMAEFVNRRLGPSSDLTNSGAIQAAIDRTTLNAIMESNSRPVSPTEVAALGWKNADAVVKSTGAGAPGEVSQGDVLSAIGSFATVRSDTFRIRAFGDARNARGEIVAKAWCEATVQRVPEYVDATDSPELLPTVPANLNFGRQFRLISFRWVHPEEV